MVDFETMWTKHIKSLEGKILPTATNKENLIMSVTPIYIERRSHLGKVSKVRKGLIEEVYNDLVEKKTLTRNYINVKFGKRCSSIIVVLLAEFPNILLEHDPIISLKII